ncbi:hypothetical protein BGZ83_001630, partial [Gryganskiella cystojenkinii]
MVHKQWIMDYWKGVNTVEVDRKQYGLIRLIPRNSFLTVGVSKYSRSQVIAKRALYKRKPAGSVAAAAPAANKTVEVKGAKNGGSRIIAAAKAPRFYAAED